MTVSRNVVRAMMAFVFLSLLALAAPAVAADDSTSLAKVRAQSKEALARLYAAQPAAREVIAGAKGYATFSRWGLKLGPVGGGIGKGLLVEHPGKETLMRFVEGSAGLGLGIKKYDLIFVFQDDAAVKAFTDGWEAGGQTTVAAKNGGTGKGIDGAASIAPGTWVYQNTEKGLVAEVGIKGTKYYKDTP